MALLRITSPHAHGPNATSAVMQSVLLATIPGIVPSLWELPPGCRFNERCAFKEDRCVGEEPLLEAAGANGERAVRCHFPLSETR